MKLVINGRNVPPQRKPRTAQPGGGGFGPRGGGNAPLAGLTAMEARSFADGKRSVLDIRHAVSVEYGPQEIGKVLAFFRELEKAGEFELREKAPASRLARWP